MGCSITIGRAPDLLTMSGKRGPSSGTMVSPRKSFFQSLDKDERDALLKIAPSLRSKFDATDRQERRLSHAASAPESPAYRLHPPSVNGRSPRHSIGALSAKSPSVAYANQEEDVDDAPPLTVTRVGGGYSGVKSPGRAKTPPAARPASATPIGHVSRATPLTRHHDPSHAASTSTRGGKKHERAFDPTLTKQLAHKEAALRFELERVRAQNVTLVAENDGMRRRLHETRKRFTATEGDFVLQSHELDRARERALGEGARRVAELEDRSDRQRRTLQELAVASEALAKDNVVLSNELVALRDTNETNETRVVELAERLSAAQRLYLAGQKSLERAEELREATNGGGALERKLDALLTPEMLARSRPPPSYPVPHALPLHPGGDASGRAGGHAGGTHGRAPGALISDRQKLAEENSRLKAKLDRSDRRVMELSAESREANGALAELRKATANNARRHNAQLTGALRRLQWLVERQGKLEADCEEKDAYAKSLERRLLNQHKTLHGVTAGKGVASTLKGGGTNAVKRVRGTSRPGSAPMGGRGLRASAAALLMTPEPESASRYRGGNGGWVTGAGRRTPEARAAIALSRRAMQMNASPTSMPVPAAGSSDTGSDADLTADDAAAAEPKRLDWGPGSSAFAGDTVISGVGAVGIALEADAAVSDDDTPRKPEWVHAPARTHDPAQQTTPPSSSGKKKKTKKPSPPPRTPPRAGDDMSMDGIQEYIAQLQDLHEKSTQLASSGGGEPSESPLLMGD